jgi:hypothetical protein
MATSLALTSQIFGVLWLNSNRSQVGVVIYGLGAEGN